MKKGPIRSKVQVADALRKYLPEAFVAYVVTLFQASNVRFKIVPGRATKLGDFRAGMNGEKHIITVNGDLNPYSFLITTVHEFAHLHTFNTFGNRVSPHGNEWKSAYRQLLLPLIDSPELPEDIRKALMNSLVRTKASSCSDHGLSRVLLNYDKPKEGVIILEHLPKNSTFALNGKHFVKGELRRKRYICQEVKSKRSYLVNSLAQVIPLND
jgi:SprT protein